MKEFKDPAIREMLRRRHAAVPPLSDDFEEKLFAAYEQRKRLQKRRNVRRLSLWPSMAAAATVALLLVFGGKSHITAEPELASITHVEKSVDISMPDKKTKENTVVKPKNIVRKKHIAHCADKSIPISNTASANTSKANASTEGTPVAPSPVFTPVSTTSLYANRDDMRRRMDEKRKDFVYAITTLSDENV